MKRYGAIIAIDTLIQLSIIAVIFLVVFLGIFPPFTQKLEAAEEKGKCEWSVLLSAVGKAGSLGIAQGIPEGCHAVRKTITLDDLRKKFGYAKNRLKIITDPAHKEYATTAPFFRTQIPDDPQVLYEFALDNVVADELADCWTKVFRGKMPLFDEWWRLYDCVKEGKTQPCSTIEEFVAFAIPAYGVWKVTTGGVQANRAPVNCVICAHLTFDEKLKKEIGRPSIVTLQEWMGNNPVPRIGTSYLKFIEEGQSDASALFTRYSFDLSDEGVAIVYERVNAQKLAQTMGKALSWAGVKVSEDKNYLKLMPYTQGALMAPTGDCTFVVD